MKRRRRRCRTDNDTNQLIQQHVEMASLTTLFHCVHMYMYTFAIWARRGRCGCSTLSRKRLHAREVALAVVVAQMVVVATVVVGMISEMDQRGSLIRARALNQMRKTLTRLRYCFERMFPRSRGSTIKREGTKQDAILMPQPAKNATI